MRRLYWMLPAIVALGTVTSMAYAETDNVGKMLDMVKDGASALATSVSGIVAQYGQPAMDLALAAARVDALNTLMPGFAGVISLAVALTVVFRCSNVIDTDLQGPRDIIYLFCIIFGGLGSLFSVFSVFTLFNAWAWVGLFHPEVYMVHMALQALHK